MATKRRKRAARRAATKRPARPRVRRATKANARRRRKVTRELRVYAIPTGHNWMGDAVHVGWATSRTGAISTARAAGYRVMEAGGLIETSPASAILTARGRASDDTDDGSVWTVTVYP